MTPDPDHRELRSLLGAYLLGGLDSADRVRLERHLTGCRECEHELARLAPVAGLLARLRDAPEPPPVEPPAADLLPSLIERSRRERRALRRRTVLTAAAAAVVAAVLAALAVPRAVPTAEPTAEPTGATTVATTVALQAAGGLDTAGSAALTAKPWGTAMTLRLDAMPPHGPFRLEITGPDGSRQVAASWGETPNGTAVVSGATALTPEEIRLIRVVGAVGTVLEGAYDEGG